MPHTEVLRTKEKPFDIYVDLFRFSNMFNTLCTEQNTFRCNIKMKPQKDNAY